MSDHLEVELSNVVEGEAYGVYVTYQKGQSVQRLLLEAILQQAVELKCEQSWPFTVTMPCGEVFTISGPDDIPTENVECPCGNPKHHMVTFEEVEKAQ